jgi:hypothetical protein
MPQTAELDRIAGVIERRDTVLFIGSGVSAWSGLPTWAGLLDDLCGFLESVGRSADLVRRELRNNDLLLAASFGFDQLSRQERCEFLRRAFLCPAAEPSPLHDAIAALGSRCFVTTNYDTLLERTLRQARANEYFDVVTPLQQLEIASIVQARADGFVFKPHGDIGSCDSMILTREDYRTLHGERRNVLEATRTLLVSRPVVFIGFGLRDPDFLLVRDLLSSTFGAHPPDHYALMPDIVPTEADYWLRHYGIRLVSYPTNPGGVGAERHKSLLTLVEELTGRCSRNAPTGQPDTTSRKILALARHARRLISAIPDVPDRMPLRLDPARFNRSESALDSRWLRGRDALTILTSYTGSLVLEGAPGSGKSFTVEQAVREIARDLEERCLADPLRRIEDLRVPVVVRLRDYQGDVTAMVADALPFDVQPEEVFAWGNGVFFLDGVNEVPSTFPANRVLADLSSFADRAAGCTVVLTTRFGEELESLGMPTLSLDEISHEYVLARIADHGAAPHPLDDDTIDLLRRPLYFNAWRNGQLDLAAAATVHDIYSQLVGGLEADARSRFGDLTYGDVFGKIAYSMIESGGLSVSVAQVHAELRTVLPREVDVAEFVNYQIFTGTLLATPRRRLAFFHHSLAEYFAARYLARLATVDQGAIRRCLSRRDWDQAILLTLGFLPQERASTVFDDVMSADPAMALRALNYVEAQRTDWTERALAFLADRRHDRIELDDIDMIGHALSQLRVTTANESSLMTLVEQGDLLGGVAAALLWDAAPGRREWLRGLLLETSRGYNFLSRLAAGIGERISDADAHALLRRASSMPLDEATEQLLRRGEEVDEYVGVMVAVSDAVTRLPVDDRIAYARGGSVMARCIVAESLWDVREPSAVAFMQELVLTGDDHAIVGLYFQLHFGEPSDGTLPQPLPGLVTALLAAVRENRKPGWAVAVIRELIRAFPDVASEMSENLSGPGLMPALAAYVTGDVGGFFAAVESLAAGDVDWSAEPVNALEHVDVPWGDRPDILLKLLRTRDARLALAVLEGLGPYPGGETGLRCRLEDQEWWIEWLAQLDAEGQWFPCDRLGSFLALATDEATRRDIVRRFNQVARDRAVLATHVLRRMPSASIDDLSAGAIEWLLSELASPGYASGCDESLLTGLATEDFVQQRLIPMLLEGPDDQVRENLLLTLRQVGVRHRRRYVDEDGSLIG